MSGLATGPADGLILSRLGGRDWVVLGTLMLATVISNVASICLFPQIAALSAEFERPVNQVVWAIAGFHIIATGVGGMAAALGAVAGHRRMLCVVVGFLLVGSVMAALSHDLPLLVVARVIQGGAMATQALAIGIITNCWRGEAMRRAMSMIVLAMALGAVIGYLAGGIIWKAGGDWRTLFWALAGGAALDLVLTLACVKESERRGGVHVDYLGCAGLVGWAVLLLLPVSQANAWGWGSAKVLGLLLPGLVVLGAWVIWELRTTQPLIDLRILRRRGVWQGGAVWLAVAVSLCVPAAAVPYLFQAPAATGFGFGRGMLAVSLALATPAALMCGISSLATRVMRRLGPWKTMLLGTMFGWSGFGLAFAHGSIGLTVVWLAAAGVAGGLAGSASYALAAERVAPAEGILVSTIYNTAAGTGSSIAAAAAGYVLTLRQTVVPLETSAGPQWQAFPAEVTFTWAALIVAGAAVGATLAVLSARPGRGRASV